MSDILTNICEYAQYRVEEEGRRVPLAEVKRQALALKRGDYPFEHALGAEGLSLVCEVKKASPSKGVIDPVFDYLQIARDYERGGADCISCLTEPKWFSGSEEIFSRIRAAVTVPMLQKDFFVSEYQIYRAKTLGADAVLLIMSALTVDRAREFFGIADGLGLTALFECRDGGQISDALGIGARVVGVNNRNLRDFSIDAGRAARLRKEAGGALFVSESGILSVADAKAQREAGADAVLLGEVLMRSKDRAALVGELKACTR